MQCYGAGWSSDGFMQHAPEYWLSACVMLEQLRSRSGSGSQDSSAEETESEKPVFNAYDDADMTQIHGLVTAMRGMDLG